MCQHQHFITDYHSSFHVTVSVKSCHVSCIFSVSGRQ